MAFHTYSRFETPPVTNVIELPSHTVLRSLTDPSAVAAKVKPLLNPPAEFFRIDIGDGVLLDGYMLKPSTFDATKKYPFITHVYGEPAGQTVNDSWGGNQLLFIDEIHRMAPTIEEILYPALEDYELDIIIGQGPSARSVKVPLQKFTLIGATTRAGLLTSPLRSRFGIVHRLEFYNASDIEEIVRRSARILNVPIDDGGRGEIARRSRGTPRIANRLLRRVRDYAQVRADGAITSEVAHAA